MQLLGPNLPAVWDYTLRYQRGGKLGGVNGRCYSRGVAEERVTAALRGLPTSTKGVIEHKGEWNPHTQDRPLINVAAIIEDGALRWVDHDGI